MSKICIATARLVSRKRMRAEEVSVVEEESKEQRRFCQVMASIKDLSKRWNTCGEKNK